jgi:hypothetical protein
MPTPQQTLDLERIMKSLHDPRAAVVILVGDHGELETATRGIDNDAALFDITFSIAKQVAAEIFDDLPAQQKRAARQILTPISLADARDLGIPFHKGP